MDGDGDFDDSTLENPRPLDFDGATNISISLKVSNTSSKVYNIHSETLNVYANPNSGYTVDFSYSPSPAIQGDLINFDEDITGFYYSYNCVWKIFGPGDYYQVSYLNNPSLSFFESGNYSIYLEAYDFYGNFLGVCSKPLTINPPGLTASPDEIEPNDVNHNAHFGYSVSMDDDFAVVGATYYFENGAIFIYKYNHLTKSWALFQGPLVIDVPKDDLFATSVAISGNYIAVSAPLHDHNGYENTGAVFIYEYNGTAWVLQPDKLAPDDLINVKGFGIALAMDGNYLVISTIGRYEYQGQAYIYKNENGAWVEKCKIFDLDGYVGDGFGENVSISGTRIAVGSSHDKAFVFHRLTDNIWEQHSLHLGSDNHKIIVSISDNALLIGDYYPTNGTAYIYEFDDGSWEFRSELKQVIPQYHQAQYGFSVKIDGNYAIIGAPGETLIEDGEGAVYIYRRNAYDVWHLVDKVTPNLQSGAVFTNTSFGFSIGSNSDHIIISRPGCFTFSQFDCTPSPPDDFPGAVTFLSNYIYPCDRIINEDDYHPSPGTYPDNSAGYISLGGNPNTEVYFQAGVDIAYIGSDILLMDGFTAAEGSDFSAKGMLCSSLPTLTPGEYIPTKVGEAFPEDVLLGESFESNYSLEQEILIFPNPTDGLLNIECLTPGIEFIKISLLDLFGKEVFLLEEDLYSEGALKTPIFIGNLNTGIYLLTITTNDKVFTEKIILQ